MPLYIDCRNWFLLIEDYWTLWAECENAQLLLVHFLQNLPILGTPNCGRTEDPALGASRVGIPTITCFYATLYSRVHEVLDKAL